jgi:hypothetical protein
MIELSDDKYVKIMWDHCATGFWDRDGANCNPMSFPFSDKVKLEVKRWAAAVGAWVDFGMDNDPKQMLDFAAYSSTTEKALSIWGLAIARKIKREKPEWTVVYFDASAAKQDEKQPREEFEYEVKV